jgi:tryptophan halogenase
MNITVIGGGTAGWLSALFFQKYSNHSITIIDSSKIGILGAGEASTPILSGLLSELGVDITDFLTKTKASRKVANDFINWSPNGGKYSHRFDLGIEDIEEYEIGSVYGFHFDARACANYFKGIAIDRGITHLDLNITNFSQNSDGDVIKIHTEEGVDVDTEFVLDCSGFARLGAGKLYNSEWISYSKYLKANTAIAYFLPQEDNITNTSNTHTQSIAMNAGWMWQVPLQHRKGCGYVFNDEYISIDEAKKEVEDYIGREIEIVKTFKYNAGSYKTTWNNNCVSLGLASGFLEPLEGTSLMAVIISLYQLNYVGIENFKNDSIRSKYNAFITNINYQSMIFIKHHYMCDRIDTPFWKDMNESTLPEELYNIRKNLQTIQSNSDLMDIIGLESSFLNHLDKFCIFNYKNYKMVDNGHKIKTKKTLF